MCSRLLNEATSYLEEEVLIPLEEMFARLKYRVELLKQMYSTQVDVIQGEEVAQRAGAVVDTPRDSKAGTETPAAVAAILSILNKSPSTNGANSTQTRQLLLNYGVNNLLLALRARQEALDKRVEGIRKIYTVQKELVESSVAQWLYIHNNVVSATVSVLLLPMCILT